MQHLVDKIQELQLALAELLPMKEEYRKKLDDKFRLEFSYNSNHLEGNTLTYGETKLLLIFGKTEGNHDKREYDEIEAHDVAFKLIQEWAKDDEQPLTETRIKQLNQIILVKPFYKEAITQDGQATRRLINIGDYKKYPNNVLLQNGEIFNFSSPTDTPIEMGELMQWYNTEVEEKELHPIVLAALLHYKFVRIHPFDDGNGRISRLLVNYVLLKNNLPPIVIKSDDKKNYLDALNKADTGNIDAFVEYIAEQLMWSLDISIKAANGEDIDEMGDWEKKLFILKNKINEDKYITETYTNANFQKLIEKAIMPLLSLWDKKLHEFDVFFNQKQFLLGVNKSNSFIASESIQVIVNTLKKYDTKGIHALVIKATFQWMRLGNKSKSYNAGEVQFTFNRNSYEVSSSIVDKIYSLLYNQFLTSDEIEKIINELCTWFYNNIEPEIVKAREENK